MTAVAAVDRLTAGQASPWSSQTLVDVARYRAANMGSKCAYLFLHGDGGEQSCTYQELDGRASSIAVRLRELAAPGSRVALLYPSGIDYVAAFFGCLYAGMVAVPAYPPSGRKQLPRLAAILQDCQAQVALVATDKGAYTELSTNPGDLAPLHWLVTSEIPLSSGTMSIVPCLRERAWPCCNTRRARRLIRAE